jgi:DNA repair protein RecO (recombination protein O)
MIKTNGVIIRSIKYGETSLIIDIFTKDFGLRSYIVNGIRKSTSKKSAAILQVTNFVDIIAYDNKAADKLNRLKEFKLNKYHDGIYSNPIKSMISQFMIEVLRKCVKDYNENVELYEFMENWFTYLNETKESLRNALLVFMVQLAGLMGIGFSNDNMNDLEFFDLQEGEFTMRLPEHKYYLSGTPSAYLKLIINAEREDMHEFNIQSSIRSTLLNELVVFFRLHIESFGELKSLPILRSIMTS